MSLLSQNPYVVCRKGLFTTGVDELLDPDWSKAGTENLPLHLDKATPAAKVSLQESEEINPSTICFMVTKESHDVAINYLFPGGDITKKDLYRFEETLPALLYAQMQTSNEMDTSDQHFDTEEELILDGMILSAKTLTNNITRAELRYELEDRQRKQNGKVFPRYFVNNLYRHLPCEKIKYANDFPAFSIQTEMCSISDDWHVIDIRYTKDPPDSKKPERIIFLFNNTAKHYVIMYAGSITKNFKNIHQDIDMKQLLTEEQRYVFHSFRDSLHTSGPKYFECLKKTDDGFWHDNAGAILQQGSPTALSPTQQQKLTTFIHTIAKRLFLINYDVKKGITYQFNASNHRVEHDDFHVIIRREKGEVLIFFCAKDQQPDNCVLCTEEKALGIAIPHHQAAVAHQPAGLPQDPQDAQVAQYKANGAGVEV